MKLTTIGQPFYHCCISSSNYNNTNNNNNNNNSNNNNNNNNNINDKFEDCGRHQQIGGRQITVLRSVRKWKDTEKGVGYLRLGVLTGCQSQHSFTTVKINRNK